MERSSDIKLRKLGFFIVLLITMLPLFVFPLESIFFHAFNKSPSVTDGVIDLKDYDFIHSREIPLDGNWEFYWNQWIVSEKEKGIVKPDLLAKVPCTWQSYEIDGKKLPKEGKASFRLIMKNCPSNIQLTSYIPNIDAKYRIYINGEFVSEQGYHNTANYFLTWTKEQRFLPTETELVIEIESKHIGGLYLTPLLLDSTVDTMKLNFRFIMAQIYLGMLFVLLGGYACIFLFRDTSVQSIALFVLNVLMLFRILFKDEFYYILRPLFPVVNFYYVNSFLRIITLFMPVIFLLCAKQLFHLQIKQSYIFFVFVYELFFSPLIFWCVLAGRPFIQHILCIISYVPFIVIMKQIYQSIKNGVPYALMVSAVFMFILTSVMVSNLNSSGGLIFNISMYPPTCFVIAAILQIIIYIRKNVENQKEALETANLRLKVKESEISMMLSQIKPHFLYNALMAIQMLCTREPETAAEAVERFSKYLRANMRSITSREPIPFSQELEHIKNYVAIEKLRFQSRLTVEYDIKTENFIVPPLTIQPLVENAIKHGACKNIDGGIVTIKTFETSENYCIQVIDDGPGFNKELLNQEDSDSHGLKNIMFRLKEWLNAKIVITSEPDCGTDILILLPKEE